MHYSYSLKNLLLPLLVGPALTGCSILFDAPSYDSMQVKSSAQSAISCDPVPQIPSQSVVDLRSTGTRSDQTTDTRSAGASDGRTVLSSRDAISELKDRKFKTPAEKKLLSGISLYDRENVSSARKVIDQPLVDSLDRPADKAIAYMYRGFIACYAKEKNACAQQFRHMYTVLPTFQVSENGVGYRQWSPILNEVTAEHRKTAAKGVVTEPSTQKKSKFVVTKTTDGSAKLVLNTHPGGSVMFDGKLVGESPPIKILMVNPGAHSLLISGRPGERFSADVDIAAGEQIEIRHDID